MKLLFVSNFYPPYHRGGYEMLCQEVTTHLEARGHQVLVLTSTYGVKEELEEPDIYRRLSLESDPDYYHPQQVLRYWQDKNSNLRAAKDIMAATSPDIVVIWGMWNLSHQVAMWFEGLAGSRVVYYVADVWPAEPGAHEAYWDNGAADSWFGKVFKYVFRGPVHLALRKEWRPFELRFEHVIACSQAVRDSLVEAGIAIDDAKIIYHGIDPLPYRKAAEGRGLKRADSPLGVVYVGSLLPQKGVHTAIEAFRFLAEGHSLTPMHLTVLGAGHPEYEAHLQKLVRRWGLDELVSFQRPIPRSELPAFLAQFDVLVLPSVYEEPQARISQEAMAAGLALVATLTGGTKEILVDGENGLAFEPEDTQGLARQLQRLAEDVDLRLRLARAGRQTITERFTISRMTNEFEAYLLEIFRC